MPASPIIEIKNLSAGYDNRTVLHDINLTIYERDFLGIIGPNGGGKTTLIKCILGLLKEWTNLSEKEFYNEYKVNGVLYCHSNRKLCITSSVESAIKVVELT